MGQGGSAYYVDLQNPLQGSNPGHNRLLHAVRANPHFLPRATAGRARKHHRSRSRSIYFPGEDAVLTLTARNAGSAPLEVTAPFSAFGCFELSRLVSSSPWFRFLRGLCVRCGWSNQPLENGKKTGPVCQSPHIRPTQRLATSGRRPGRSLVSAYPRQPASSEKPSIGDRQSKVARATCQTPREARVPESERDQWKRQSLPQHHRTSR